MILSNLEGVTEEIYANNILPRFLGQVLLSRDKVAQDYLYDAVIQAFPTEYLLKTIHTLLHSLGGVVANVGLRVILCNLMDRISQFVVQNPEYERSLDMYEIFSSHITQIITTQTLSCEDYIKIFSSLAKLAIVWHSKEDAYSQLNSINDNLYEYISMNQTFDEKAAEVLISILKFPFDKYDFYQVLSMRVYPELINMLPYRMRHDMHRFVAKKMNEMKFIATNGDEIALIIRSVETLYKDAKDMFPLNDEELAIDCGLFKQCILSIEIAKETFFDIMKEIKGQIRYAGNRRTLMIMPSVIELHLRGIKQIPEEKILLFKQTHTLLKTLYPLSHFETLKSTVDCGVVGCEVEYEQAPYFFEMALTNIEDNNDVNTEEGLKIVIAGLAKCEFPEEKTEILLVNCAKFVGLIKESEKKSIVYCLVADALFTEEKKTNAKLAVSMLQKAVKEAGLIQDIEDNITTMITILERFIEQLGRGNEEVTVEYINNFANVIKDQLAQNDIPELQELYQKVVSKCAESENETIKNLQL